MVIFINLGAIIGKEDDGVGCAWGREGGAKAELLLWPTFGFMLLIVLLLSLLCMPLRESVLILLTVPEVTV